MTEREFSTCVTSRCCACCCASVCSDWLHPAGLEATLDPRDQIDHVSYRGTKDSDTTPPALWAFCCRSQKLFCSTSTTWLTAIFYSGGFVRKSTDSLQYLYVERQHFEQELPSGLWRNMFRSVGGAGALVNSQLLELLPELVQELRVLTATLHFVPFQLHRGRQLSGSTELPSLLVDSLPFSCLGRKRLKIKK